MSDKKIKIGLDFHGVLATNPDYFANFCRQVIAKGWELHIISGGPRKDISEYLALRKIPYTKLYTILEVCEKEGTVRFFEDGSFYVKAEIWDKAKGEYCRKHKINLHIDDSASYEQYFSTPFCLYKQHKGKCVIGKENYAIRFTDGIGPALQKIEKFINESEM